MSRLIASASRFCSPVYFGLILVSASRLQFTSVSTTIRNLLFCADAIRQAKIKWGVTNLNLTFQLPLTLLPACFDPKFTRRSPTHGLKCAFRSQEGGRFCTPPRYNSNCTKERSSSTSQVPATIAVAGWIWLWFKLICGSN